MNLLILPLLAGYYALTNFYPLKYRQQRFDNQRLVFETVFCAATVTSLTYIVRVFCELLAPVEFDSLYRLIPLKEPFAGTSIGTLLLTVIVTELSNSFISERTSIIEAIRKVGNELEIILEDSFTNEVLLQITLKNNKVYVAWVKELPKPSLSNYTRVIAAMSEYRNDKKEVIYTTQYLTVYSDYISEGKEDEFDQLDLDLVISNSEIVSVSYFDQGLHNRFNKIKKTRSVPTPFEGAAI